MGRTTDALHSAAPRPAGPTVRRGRHAGIRRPRAAFRRSTKLQSYQGKNRGFSRSSRMTEELVQSAAAELSA
ncbi:MAG TPA: hypothetical protein VEF90_03755, partial [Xanthobacteraceae bacterium]|nr:hypothetical protein [Xanthobacteraceae bacterium]